MKPFSHIGPLTLVIILSCFLAACSSPTSYDVILRGGTVYDGSGDKPYAGDLAFIGDKIAAIGDIQHDVLGQRIAH
jgi:N-acyl-D-amino-acid deacylase